MKILSSATRLDTTDPVNYPDGQIKDATTSTAKDGTLLNKVLLADIRTFFSYCVRKAGITPNDNYDTVSNSQIADAVMKTVSTNNVWTTEGITAQYGAQIAAEAVKINYTDGGKTLRVRGRVLLSGAAWDGSPNLFLIVSGNFAAYASDTTTHFGIAEINTSYTEWTLPPSLPVTVYAEKFDTFISFTMDAEDIAYFNDKVSSMPYSIMLDITIPLTY